MVEELIEIGGVIEHLKLQISYIDNRKVKTKDDENQIAELRRELRSARAKLGVAKKTFPSCRDLTPFRLCKRSGTTNGLQV